MGKRAAAHAFSVYTPCLQGSSKFDKSAAEGSKCPLPQEHTLWNFFRKFIKKIKGPWPETSTGARMNPRTSLICGCLALVVMGLAAARVTYSLYDIQIKNGDTYRQLAAKQQLLDTTIKATRGEIYDTSGITLASTSVVWTIWADTRYSSILYTSKTQTLPVAISAEVIRSNFGNAAA